MESEKVKEIKEYLQEEVFIATKFEDKLRRIPTRDLKKILTLINELEKEKAKLDMVVKHNQELIEDGKLISVERLKQFVEKLKEKVHERDYVQGYAEIGLCEEIDETLKEFLK